MPRVSFDISEHAKFAQWVKRGVEQAAKKGALSAAIRTLGEIQQVLIPHETPQPVDTGAYRAAWQVEPTAGGADVYNALPYASVIEFGARPENVKIGRKMIDALKKWVLRKGFFGKDSAGKKAADTDGRAESMAWAIAVAMKKRGIFNRGEAKGLRIAEKAAKFAAGVLPEEVAREIKKALG